MGNGAQQNFTCSQELYGDWVWLSKNDTVASEIFINIREMRVFGREYQSL